MTSSMREKFPSLEARGVGKIHRYGAALVHDRYIFIIKSICKRGGINLRTSRKILIEMCGCGILRNLSKLKFNQNF